MAVSKVVMPKLSEAMEAGKIIKWLKKEGDVVKGGDILAEIETDKADVEMEAFGGGVLRKIFALAGAKMPVGALIGVIAEPGDDISALLAAAPAPGAVGAGEPSLARSTTATRREDSPAPPALAPAAPSPHAGMPAPVAASPRLVAAGLGRRRERAGAADVHAVE